MWKFYDETITISTSPISKSSKIVETNMEICVGNDCNSDTYQYLVFKFVYTCTLHKDVLEIVDFITYLHGFFCFFLNDKSKNIYPYQATRAVNCFLYNICSTSFAFDMICFSRIYGIRFTEYTKTEWFQNCNECECCFSLLMLVFRSNILT